MAITVIGYVPGGVDVDVLTTTSNELPLFHGPGRLGGLVEHVAPAGSPVQIMVTETTCMPEGMLLNVIRVSPGCPATTTMGPELEMVTSSNALMGRITAHAANTRIKPRSRNFVLPKLITKCEGC